MRPDPPLVNQTDLVPMVRKIVSDVLMVPTASVSSTTRLSELGAESIDYLDLIFRIEEGIGRRVPIARWEQFITTRLPGANLSEAITVAILVEFAAFEADREA